MRYWDFPSCTDEQMETFIVTKVFKRIFTSAVIMTFSHGLSDLVFIIISIKFSLQFFISNIFTRTFSISRKIFNFHNSCSFASSHFVVLLVTDRRTESREMKIKRQARSRSAIRKRSLYRFT